MDKIKPVAILLFILISGSVAVFNSKGVPLSFGENKIKYFADRITKICSVFDFRRPCYDRQIPKILKNGFASMEETFLITNKIQESDKGYMDCHALGHELADIETRKNPSGWQDVMSRCPQVTCNSGCTHGAVMRRFKGSEVLSDSQLNELMPELAVACEPRGSWRPSSIEMSLCYHSIGHMAMYVTEANIQRSLDICKEVSIKKDGRDYYQTCTQGVFMIIFQAKDNEDLALVSDIRPTKETVSNFCSKYTGTEMAACRIESWPYFLDQLRTPKQLAEFCSFAKDWDTRKWCFDDSGMRGGVSVEILQKDGVGGVANYCMEFPDDIKERCFSSVATAWVQNEPYYIKESVKLCNEAEKLGFGKQCFEHILAYSLIGFSKDTEAWSNYCMALPAIQKERCLSGDVPNSW